MPQQKILVSVITPEPKPCRAKIEYEEVPEEVQGMALIWWPKETAPFMMPFLVVESAESAEGVEEGKIEDLYINAVLYLIVRALADDISLGEFAEDLVIFCERFGQVFSERRISIVEARLRLGWTYMFLPLLKEAISIFKKTVAKDVISAQENEGLIRLTYEPYLRATKNYPEHKGNFAIDFFTSDNKFFAHPVDGKPRGLLLPNKGPANKDHDEILKWCQSVALSNLDRFLKRNISLVTTLDLANGITMSIKVKDIYTWIALLFIEKDIHWLSRNDLAIFNEKREISWAKQERRKALAMFRNRKNRPKSKDNITEDEYKTLVEYSATLLKYKHTKHELADELENHLLEGRSSSVHRVREEE